MSWDTLPAAHPSMSPHLPVLVTASVFPWWAGVGTDWGHWSNWEVPWWEAGKRWEHRWGLCWMRELCLDSVIP